MLTVQTSFWTVVNENEMIRDETGTEHMNRHIWRLDLFERVLSTFTEPGNPANWSAFWDGLFRLEFI